MIDEHKSKLEAEMKKKQDSIRQELEAQVAIELASKERSQQQIDSYQLEVENTLQQLREELASMDQKHKSKSAEIIQLKTRTMELQAELNRAREEVRLEAIQQMNDIRLKFGEELTEKERHIVELNNKIALQEREGLTWKEKIQREVETEAKRALEQHQKEFEIKLRKEEEAILKQQAESIKIREEAIHKQELEMIDRMTALREQQELDIVSKSIKLEKELTDRYQRMKEELLEKEQERHSEKERYPEMFYNSLFLKDIRRI
jgi:hypothetical protein